MLFLNNNFDFNYILCPKLGKSEILNERADIVNQTDY